mmetsp:Transcript_107672/g.309950  ORF Transcript_107672/g.309950 Transcript_107672/m.309950 type:complete len:232 (+) Transcript_107672:699-1394(+)
MRHADEVREAQFVQRPPMFAERALHRVAEAELHVAGGVVARVLLDRRQHKDVVQGLGEGLDAAAVDADALEADAGPIEAPGAPNALHPARSRRSLRLRAALAASVIAGADASHQHDRCVRPAGALLELEGPMLGAFEFGHLPRLEGETLLVGLARAGAGLVARLVAIRWLGARAAEALVVSLAVLFGRSLVLAPLRRLRTRAARALALRPANGALVEPVEHPGLEGAALLF